MSDEITTLKTCLLQMQNANVDLVKQLDDCRRECAELKARLVEEVEPICPNCKSDEKKIDGYIAWHIDHGFSHISFADHKGDSRMFLVEDHKWWTRDRGWKVRPVKLLFLDDPKPQGEE